MTPLLLNVLACAGWGSPDPSRVPASWQVSLDEKGGYRGYYAGPSGESPFPRTTALPPVSVRSGDGEATTRCAYHAVRLCLYEQFQRMAADRGDGLLLQPTTWTVGILYEGSSPWKCPEQAPPCIPTDGVSDGWSQPLAYREVVYEPTSSGKGLAIRAEVEFPAGSGSARALWRHGSEFSMRLWEVGRTLALACALHDAVKRHEVLAKDEAALGRLETAIDELGVVMLAVGARPPDREGDGSGNAWAEYQTALRVQEATLRLNGWWQCELEL
jgi:hypothetical protein